MAEPKRRRTETTYVDGRGHTSHIAPVEGADDTTATFNAEKQDVSSISRLIAARKKKKAGMTPGEGAAALANRKKEAQ